MSERARKPRLARTLGALKAAAAHNAAAGKCPAVVLRKRGTSSWYVVVVVVVCTQRESGTSERVMMSIRSPPLEKEWKLGLKQRLEARKSTDSLHIEKFF